MSNKKTGIAQIGDQATPVSLGATGGATDVGTLTHGEGQKAIAVDVYDSTNGARIPDADVTVTQPDANTIVLTNTTGGALDVVAIAVWEVPTPGATGVIPASDVVLS
jgi:hypothetical protein